MYNSVCEHGAVYNDRGCADIPILNVFTWIKLLRVADENNDWGYRRIWGVKKPEIGDIVVFNSSDDDNTLLAKRKIFQKHSIIAL